MTAFPEWLWWVGQTVGGGRSLLPAAIQVQGSLWGDPKTTLLWFDWRNTFVHWMGPKRPPNLVEETHQHLETVMRAEFCQRNIYGRNIIIVKKKILNSA